MAPFSLGDTSTLVQRCALSFYADVELLRIVEYRSSPPFEVRVLRQGQRLRMLDGNSEPVLAVNRTAPLRLSRDVVVDYLRFYFEHVDHETCSTASRSPLAGAGDVRFSIPPAADVGQRVAERARAPEVEQRADGGWVVELSALVDECLRRLRVEVEPDGAVHVVSEVTELSGLPGTAEPEVH